MGNSLRNPQVGLLFIDLTSPKRLGQRDAAIDEEDPLLADYTGAQLDRARARAASSRTARGTSTG